MRKICSPFSDPTPLFRHGDAAARTSEEVLDFSVNVNPLGPPVHAFGIKVLAALLVKRENTPVPAPAVAHYPDPGSQALVEQLAAQHGVEPDQIIVGNGSSELIHAIPRAFRPQRVAIAEPTFTEYLRASLLVEAAVVHWLAEGDDFHLEPFDPEDADLVWLCNPNNPTGQLWQHDVLVPWIEAHPRTLFVVDEAFLPFRDDEPAHTLVSAVGRLGNLIVVRSLTKIFTLPGVRLGYAVTSPERAMRLREHLVPWSVNGLAQVVGVPVLKDTGFLAETRAWFTATRAAFLDRLRTCSACVRPVPSEANFVLLQLRDTTAAWAAARLAERGIAVRDASNFVGLDGHYLRVAMRKARDNERLFAELRTLFLDG